MAAFQALGITPNDVRFHEGALQVIGRGSTVPELVTHSGHSVEVKRCPGVVRNAATMTRGRRGAPVWHWARMIESGLTKLTPGLTTALAGLGCPVYQHTLVVLVPERMSTDHRGRIERFARRVLAALRVAGRICVRTKLVVATASDDLF